MDGNLTGIEIWRLTSDTIISYRGDFKTQLRFQNAAAISECDISSDFALVMSPAFILYIYRNDTCVLLCVHTYPYICISGWIYTQGPASAPQTCILTHIMCCHICLFIHFSLIFFSLRITLECNASLCLKHDFIIHIHPQYLGRREKVRQNCVALRDTCQRFLS